MGIRNVGGGGVNGKTAYAETLHPISKLAPWSLLQKVSCNIRQKSFESFKITCGALQGSDWGPFLFLLSNFTDVLFEMFYGLQEKGGESHSWIKFRFCMVMVGY